MRRRRYLSIGSGLLTSVVGSSGVVVLESELERAQDEPNPLEFDGTGATVTDEFELEGVGYVTVEADGTWSLTMA